MKIAILLYGYFYIDQYITLFRASHSQEQLKHYYFVTDAYQQFLTNIINPLKAAKHTVNNFMITHEFSHPKYQHLKNELINTCKDFNIYFTNKIESPKLPYTYFNLIKHVMQTGKYDRYIILRNDLAYKKKITHWIPQYYNGNYCWFLFKDYEMMWKSERKISDIIFIIDGDIEIFKKSILNYIKIHANRQDMHSIYPILEKNYKGNINWIVDGYYDSNTARETPWSCNPIYRMINRPYYFSDG